MARNYYNVIMKEEVNMINTDYYETLNDRNFFAFIPNSIAQVKTMLNMNASQDIPYVLVYVKNVKSEYATSKMHEIADIVTKNTFYLRAHSLDYTCKDAIETVKTYCRNFFDNGLDYVANNEHDIEKEVDRINTDCWSRYDSLKNTNIDEEDLITFAINRTNISQNRLIMKAIKHYVIEHINLDYSDEHVLYQAISDIASVLVDLEHTSFKEVYETEKKVYDIIQEMAESREDIIKIKTSSFKNIKIDFETGIVSIKGKQLDTLDEIKTQNLARIEMFESREHDGKKSKSLARFLDETTESLHGQDLWTAYSKWYANRTDKGRCLANYIKKDGLVYIPREEVTNAIRKYCSKNHIKIIRV